MAQELGVNPQNLALVQQGHFHVDMDLFTHGSTVYMNNAKPHKDKSIYYDCSVEALLKAEESRLQWNQKVLEGVGLTVCLAPGVDDNRNINFMNGFVLPTDEGPVYITNGVSRRDEGFLERFEEVVGGTLRVLPLGKGLMQEILLHTKGGLNCLVQRRPENTLKAV